MASSNSSNGGRPLAARVAETISRYNMLSRAHSVGVAVSGGADSIFLLTVLKQLVPRLMILHLNHGLRGAESEGDEAFVVETAARVRLPLVVERAAGLSGPNLEEKARRARYEFFARAAREHNLDRVATGHTLDDQAETFLLRLLRGAGATGLSGILPVTPAGIVRPLLEVERAELENWLRGRRISWREDSSNRDPAFARNRIRHELLPLLEREWNAGIRHGLARTAGLFEAEEDYWRNWTERELSSLAEPAQGGKALILELNPLGSMHPAPLRRLLRAAVERVRGAGLRQIDQEHIRRLAGICQSGRGSGSVDLPGLSAVRSFGQLLLTPEPAARRAAGWAIEVATSGAVKLRDGHTLRFRVGTPTCRNGYNTDGGVWTDQIDPPVVVRTWQPGDAYRPAGHTRRLKLKDLFQQHKVPSWERPGWPIIESKGQIVWARQFGLADGVSLNWTCEDELCGG